MPEVQPTNNPVPSDHPADARDNFKRIDEVVNLQAPQTNPTRTGKRLNTLFGIESNYIASPINGGVWASGITFTAYNQYMAFNGVSYKPSFSTPLPYETQGSDPTVSSDSNFVEPFSEINSTNISNFTRIDFDSISDAVTSIGNGDYSLGTKISVDDYYGGATPNNSGVLFFKVVAAGTGTADGGKRIDVPGGAFQLEQILKSAPYDARAWGVRGVTGVDDATAFSAAVSYVESVTSKDRMQELYFDVLNLTSRVLINNYSAPFILRGNKIYDEYEVGEPCLVYGEDLSTNGIYEFQIKNFNIENRTSLSPTKTLGFVVYHSAYHVGIGVTTTGFQIGHEIVSCIGADYDMQSRTSTNEITNFQATITGSRRNNLVKYRNHKHKLTGSSGTAWIIEDGGGLDIQNQIHDVLPQGCRPYRLSRCYEQSERNANKIFGGWSENYGEVPALIEDSIVDIEQHFFVPRGSINPLDPNQTLEYCVQVTGSDSRVNAKNVFSTSAITSYIFNLDTTTMTDKNILLSTFDNVSGGVSGGVEVKASNVASSNGSQDGFSIELLGNVEASGFVFDLDAQLQAANLPVATDLSNSSIEIEFSGGAGLTNVALNFAKYSLGVTKNSGAYNCQNVVGGDGASTAPITVTFPSPRKPIFTFDSTTSSWQNLTAHFRFVRQSSRFQ